MQQTLYMLSLNKKYDYFLGYALGGGGAKGFAHIGALQYLNETGLKPEVICGTSAGSLAGVLYADGYHPQEIFELFKSREVKDFLQFKMMRNGFFRMDGLHKFLKNNLRAKSFETLQMPFIAVVTDWERAKTVYFSQGNNLVDSVVASCSVPIMFEPVVIDGTTYVDGGLFKNFPVSVIRQQCKYVIGVNVTSIIPAAEDNSIREISQRTFNMMSNANTLIDRKLCDILIETKNKHPFAIKNFSKINIISEEGYSAALEIMEDESSKKILKRCLRYNELNNKVKQIINNK